MSYINIALINVNIQQIKNYIDLVSTNYMYMYHV